jgi:hypothetical protein
MTAFDIDALIAVADLTDPTDRRMLADACEEAGRDLDALLLDSDTPLRLVSGRLAPADPLTDLADELTDEMAAELSARLESADDSDDLTALLRAAIDDDDEDRAVRAARRLGGKDAGAEIEESDDAPDDLGQAPALWVVSDRTLIVSGVEVARWTRCTRGHWDDRGSWDTDEDTNGGDRLPRVVASVLEVFGLDDCPPDCPEPTPPEECSREEARSTAGSLLAEWRRVEVRWEIDDHGGYEEESPGPWRVLSFHPPGVTVEEVETWYTLRGPERYDREPGSPGREARVRVRVEEEYVTEREYGRWSEAAGEYTDPVWLSAAATEEAARARDEAEADGLEPTGEERVAKRLIWEEV